MEKKDIDSDQSPPGYRGPLNLHDVSSGIDHIKPQHRNLYDRSITLEEYHYYAQKTRAEQDALEKPKTPWSSILKGKKHTSEDVAPPDAMTGNLSKKSNRLEITDEEWTNASRAFRTASAGACFYLVSLELRLQEADVD